MKLKYKDKLRERGLVKREVWVLPENQYLLKQLEFKLRNATMSFSQLKECSTMDVNDLFSQFQVLDPSNGIYSCELVENTDVLELRVVDREDFPIYTTVGDQQILMILPLLNVSEVSEKDRVSLNETMLQMNTMLPLSDFAIVNEQYVLFGALSVKSAFNEIVEEAVTLAGNVESALELFDDLLD